MPPRPALLPVEHPLCYTSGKSATQLNGTRSAMKNHDSTSTRSPLDSRSLEDKVRYLYEHQQITDLLNEYAYVLDVCMVNHEAISRWVDLFTADCEFTYPFGNHRGRDGLATWAMNAETRFYRMLHASSNFTITFDPHQPDVAHARTTLHAICGTDEHDLGRTFQEGGYYYWSFRKVGTRSGANGERGSDAADWKISYLFLDVNWTSGDSLGLNEPGAAD